MLTRAVEVVCGTAEVECSARGGSRRTKRITGGDTETTRSTHKVSVSVTVCDCRDKKVTVPFTVNDMFWPNLYTVNTMFHAKTMAYNTVTTARLTGARADAHTHLYTV